MVEKLCPPPSTKFKKHTFGDSKLKTVPAGNTNNLASSNFFYPGHVDIDGDHVLYLILNRFRKLSITHKYRIEAKYFSSKFDQVAEFLLSQLDILVGEEQYTIVVDASWVVMKNLSKDMLSVIEDYSQTISHT